MRLWHGGVPGLNPGDVIEPGHDRRAVEGCKMCEARAAQAAGGPRPTLDPLALREDKVYLSTDREYARHYASLYGYGDLYAVEPLGPVEPSTEDTMETYVADAARVLYVLERAVLLSDHQRRRLFRRWQGADEAVR